jgi:NH3-dependent NAD+ synthetase
MTSELQNKYNNLINWIDNSLKYKNENKVIVLMNDHLSGFISSQIALNKFGKENLLNIIMLCYSNPSYLINSTEFSHTRGIKCKNVSIKKVYDDIMEPDFEKDIEKKEGRGNIIEFIRKQIMKAIALENNAVIFNIMKEYENTLDDYVFEIIFSDPFKQNVFIIDKWESSFKEEDLIEIAKQLDINV